VLLLQVVLLHIRSHSLGDVRARILRSRGAAQEGAQLIGKRSGKLKDRRLARLDLLALHRLLDAAAALVGLLLKLGHTLVYALQLCNKGSSSLAKSICMGEHGLNIILNRAHGAIGLNGRSLHSGRHNGCRGRGYNGCRDSRGYRTSRSGLLTGLLLLRGNNNGGRNNGCRSRRSSLLGNRLLRLRSRRGVHYTGGRGSIHGGNTHRKGGYKINFWTTFHFCRGKKFL
jgi:hypothetical protein